MLSTLVTVALSVAYFALGWTLRGIEDRSRRHRAVRRAESVLRAQTERAIQCDLPRCHLEVLGCTRLDAHWHADTQAIVAIPLRGRLEA